MINKLVAIHVFIIELILLQSRIYRIGIMSHQERKERWKDWVLDDIIELPKLPHWS